MNQILIVGIENLDTKLIILLENEEVTDSRYHQHLIDNASPELMKLCGFPMDLKLKVLISEVYSTEYYYQVLDVASHGCYGMYWGVHLIKMEDGEYLLLPYRYDLLNFSQIYGFHPLCIFVNNEMDGTPPDYKDISKSISFDLGYYVDCSLHVNVYSQTNPLISFDAIRELTRSNSYTGLIFIYRDTSISDILRTEHVFAEYITDVKNMHMKKFSMREYLFVNENHFYEIEEDEMGCLNLERLATASPRSRIPMKIIKTTLYKNFVKA